MTSTVVTASASAEKGRGGHPAPRDPRRLRREHRALDLERDKVVLLFFEDFDKDVLFPGDRQLVRLARRSYHALRGKQRVSGFEVAFLKLKSALERAGYSVVVNDFKLARGNPRYPIGIAGYPHVLERWSLPNPCVLGPGLLDHPRVRPDLMTDPRFRSYIVPSQWMKDLFERTYADRCFIWFGGTDLNEWPDFRGEPKDIDILLYDKILWDREAIVKSVLEPILAELLRRRLRVQVVRYRTYDHPTYRALLARSQAMLFLCEHETQGLAYQEALACNVPVLAWDQGYWLDPLRSSYESTPVESSSVPYFSAECGERFADRDGFAEALDRFLERRAHYEPRRYVAAHLSFEESARVYLEHYRAAAV
jgi:glycosyltransferase involved in cell wall biosynthesis